MALALVLTSTLWGLACGEEEEGTPCETCLSSGGTWQVEANTCTTDCNIQDISCFRDSCPGPCAADSCGTCFSQGDCEAVDCTWRAEAEANWCTAAS
jgi:hypothetical protein